MIQQQIQFVLFVVLSYHWQLQHYAKFLNQFYHKIMILDSKNMRSDEEIGGEQKSVKSTTPERVGGRGVQGIVCEEI